MKRVTVVFAALALVACGGGSSPTTPTVAAPTPAPTPEPPPASKLTMGIDGIPTWTITSETSSIICGDMKAVFLIIESAGLGARIVTSDTFVTWADGDIEGRRVIDQDFRIEPHSRATLTAERFECAIKRNELPPMMTSKVFIVDDRGNEHNLEVTTGFERR